MKKKNLLLIAVFVALIAIVIALPKGNKGMQGGGPGKGGAAEVSTFRITSTQAVKGDIQSYIETNGDVEADNTVDVYPDIAGKLVNLRVQLGSHVAKGAAIADIDPSKPGASYSLSPVYAPISGTITSTPQKIGATVSTGTSVASIGDISNLQVSAKIPERDVAVLKTGLQAIVTFEAYPGLEFPAHVFRVSPLVDSTSRTKEIFLSFDSKDERINAGMFAKIKLFTTVVRGCVTVPEDAIVTSDDKKYAFVVGSDGTVAKREVTVGASVDGVSEIVSGLKTGEKIAEQGVSSLADGARVKDISTKSEISGGGAQ